MSDRDSITNRRNNFVDRTFKDFYRPDELRHLMENPLQVVLAADALVGQVADENSAEFIVDYLSGVPQTTLREEYRELSSTHSGERWLVARVAKNLASQALVAADIPTVADRDAYVFPNTLPRVNESLHDTIITLYEHSSINSDLAQGMLLLFNQSESSANSTVQTSALFRTRKRLKDAMSLSSVYTKKRQTPHERKSQVVLQLFTDLQTKSNGRFGYTNMQAIEAVFTQENRELSQQQIRSSIEAYLAHGLTLLYAED